MASASPMPDPVPVIAATLSEKVEIGITLASIVSVRLLDAG